LDQHHNTTDDRAADMLERRWFAAARAVADISAECDALEEVFEMAMAEWRQARTKLAELERMRDALEAEIALIEDMDDERPVLLERAALNERSAA